MAFNNLPIEACDDQVGRGERVVVDPAWLNHHKRLCAAPVDSAGVAKGVGSKPAAGDFAVGMKDFFAEGGQKHGGPSVQFPTCSCRWLSPESNEKKNEYWVRHCTNLDKTKQEMQVHAK